jgi:hypothetical protein
MTSVENIVSILDAFESNNSLSFYIPTLKREVKFKPINTGQQKALLKAAIDNPVFQTRFIVASYKIITENCLEKSILPELTAIDGNAILVQYKASIYGNEQVIVKDEQEYKVDLSKIIENYKNVSLPEQETVSDNNITLVVGAPSLQDQYLLESQIRDKNLTDEDVLKKNTEIGAMLGEAFVCEVSKYIKQISLLINDKLQDINYKDLSPAKKLLVVEKLPSATVKKAINYMTKISALAAGALKIEGTNTKDGSAGIVEISIDSTLFPVE